MKKYHVEMTDEAIDALEAVREYIAVNLQSPLNAATQMKRLMAGIISLDILPERYSVVDMEPWKSKQLRYMPVDSYTVFYIIRGERVIITNVLYSASDLIARLRKR